MNKDKLETSLQYAEKLKQQLEKDREEFEKAKKRWVEILADEDSNAAGKSGKQNPCSSRNLQKYDVYPKPQTIEDLQARAAELNEAIKNAKLKAKDRAADAAELRRHNEEIKAKITEYMQALRKAEGKSQTPDSEIQQTRKRRHQP